jgi:hypothetical protein
MAPLPVLFAADDPVKEHIQPYIEKALEFLSLPRDLPHMPVVGIPAAVMLGFGALFLLIFLWRLLTLRIFRAIFALIAVALVSYYPAAYGFNYWFYKYQLPSGEEGRTLESWEQWVKDNPETVDYSIMAAGFVIGFLFLYLSRVRPKKNYGADSTSQPVQPSGQPGSPFNFG